MIAFFTNIFGYILNYIYSFVNNYGLSIIIFSILLKILLIPLSIKQQKTMKKSTEMQKKVKEIQKKYDGNMEKINQETMDLYKREKMNPFSGCFSAIIQIVLLFSMFYLVRNPLTYMKKIDSEIINQYEEEIKEEYSENENNSSKSTAYPEIQIIKEKGSEDERVYINMDFFGLDLSNVPSQNMDNATVYIIPVLYVLSSLFSMKLTTQLTGNKKQENSESGEKNDLEAVEQANKSMMWFMPIMSVSISLVAPLGLALYWLVNNILMILERICINKYIEKGEETENA